MSKDTFNSKIRDSFGADEKSAPTDLWARIESGANLSESENVIRESFSGISKTAPADSWLEINRQLVIDDVWTRINTYYDRRRFILWWSRLAGILLLISVGIYGLSILGSNTAKVQSYHERSVSNEIAEADGSHTPEEMGVSANDYTGTYDDAGNASIDRDEVNPTGADRKASNLKTSIEIHSSESISNNSTEIDNSQEEGIVVNRINTNSSGETNNENLVVSVNTHENSETAEKREGSPIVKIPYPFTLSLPHSAERAIIGSPPIEILEFEGEFEPYADLGLTAFIGQTNILNNDVKTGFNSNSLINNKISIGYSGSAEFNYYFTRRSGLNVELDFISASNQRYNFYSEGRYTQRKLNINYSRLSVAYKLSTLDRQNDRSVFNLTAGLYAGINMKDSDKSGTTNVPASFSRFDWGGKVSIGREHFLGKFTAEYGLQSNIGFHNIATDQQDIPKKFNFTNNFALGGYASLRYNF